MPVIKRIKANKELYSIYSVIALLSFEYQISRGGHHKTKDDQRQYANPLLVDLAVILIHTHYSQMLKTPEIPPRFHPRDEI